MEPKLVRTSASPTKDSFNITFYQLWLIIGDRAIPIGSEQRTPSDIDALVTIFRRLSTSIPYKEEN